MFVDPLMTWLQLMIVVSLKETGNLTPWTRVKERESWFFRRIISRPYDHYKG